MGRGPFSDLGNPVGKNGPAATVGRMRTAAAAVRHDRNRDRKSVTTAAFAGSAEKREPLQGSPKHRATSRRASGSPTIVPTSQNQSGDAESTGLRYSPPGGAAPRATTELALPIAKRNLLEPRIGHVTVPPVAPCRRRRAPYEPAQHTPCGRQSRPISGRPLRAFVGHDGKSLVGSNAPLGETGLRTPRVLRHLEELPQARQLASSVREWALSERLAFLRADAIDAPQRGPGPEGPRHRSAQRPEAEQ